MKKKTGWTTCMKMGANTTKPSITTPTLAILSLQKTSERGRISLSHCKVNNEWIN